MRSILAGMAVVVSLAGLGDLSPAEEKPSEKSAAKDTRFEKIKSLSGDWEVTKGPADHGHHGTTISYKVTAAGSAVQETMFGGTDHEMITMYYIEGKDLAMTHYCMLQNRPKMRSEAQTKPDKIVFKCHEKDNAGIEAEDHMHQATITFVDADHLKAEWVLYKDGKPDSTHVFEFARKSPRTTR